MKRLTIYLRNQKRVAIEGEEKLFNVKTFKGIYEENIKHILSRYNKKDILKYEIR